MSMAQRNISSGADEGAENDGCGFQKKPGAKAPPLSYRSFVG